MNDVRLVPYLPKWEGPCLEICQRSILEASGAAYTPAQRKAWAALDLDDWATRLRDQRTSVLTAPNVVLGLASWRELSATEAWLDMLYVHPDHQRRGWGQRLLEAVELDVHTSHALALLTQASEHLQPLLLSRGYDVVESKVVELRGEHLPCAVMRKVLS